MKKQLFDVRLYRDGIRQLKVLGCVIGIFMMLEAILVPVYRMLVFGERNGYYRMDRLTNIDLMGMHPMVLAACVFAVPVMMLSLFRFLNHRNASDFYHSIPQTRQCLCLSYLAAVLTWALGLQWASTILSLCLHMILRTGVAPLMMDILLQGISISIVCVLVAGATLLAVSVTGNTFSNVIVTGMILFAPRLVMLILKFSVGNSLTLISTDQYLTFLGNGWNILTGMIFGLLEISENYRKLLMTAPPMLYTLGLGLAYMAAGLYFFTRRPSECSGQAAVSRNLQLIFRLVPAFLFGMIPDIIIYTELATGDMIDETDIFLYGVLYLLSAIFYFLYELISTRKLRNLKKALPGVAILLVLHVAVVMGTMGMRNSILAFCPAAEEIDSVSLSVQSVTIAMNENQGDYVYNAFDGYLSSRASQVPLTDPEVKAIVADRLATAVAYDRGAAYSGDSGRYISVGITVDGRTVYRRIPMTQADATRFSEALKREPAVEEIYMNLPDAKDPNLRLNLSDGIVDEEVLREIYAALKEDVADMGFAEWYRYTADYYYVDSAYTLVNLYMAYTDHMSTTASQIPITDLTPRAAEVYLKAMHQEDVRSGAFEEAANYLKLIMNSDPELMEECYFSAYGNYIGSNKDMQTQTVELDLYNRESIGVLLDLLEQQSQQKPQPDSEYLALDLNLELYQNALGELVTYAESGDNYAGYYENLTLLLPEGFDWTKACGNNF